MLNNSINFTKLQDGNAPFRVHEYDAGADLYALQDTVLPSLPNKILSIVRGALWYWQPTESLVTKVPTGIAIEIPRGEVGLIMDRSSIGAKSVKVFGGVIDSSYIGDVTVCLINLSFADIQIKKGDRVAQLVIVPCRNYKFKEVEVLGKTERGVGGFGSSNVVDAVKT